MAQEINEQEHIEKPKSPRRAAGTRKKAAADSGTEAGTDTDARADAGSAASGPRAEDSEAPAENPEPSAAPAEAQRVMPHGSPPFLRRKALPMLRLRKRQSPLRKLPEQI